MASDRFIVKERAAGTGGSARVLLRFAGSLRGFRALLLLGGLFAVMGSIGFQIFAWISGELSHCETLTSCTVRNPWGGGTLGVGLAFLGICALVSFVTRVAGWWFVEVGGQLGAVALFRRLVRSVARVRTTFFDENPSGRVINRLVRDFDQLRYMGVIRIGDALNGLIELAVAAALIGFAHPLAALFVLPTFLIFLYIQRQVAPMLQRCLSLRAVELGTLLHRETDVIEGARTYLLHGHHGTLLHLLRTTMAKFLNYHLARAQIEAWGRFWSSAAAAVCSFVALAAVAIGVRDGSLSMVMGAVIVTAVFRLGGTFGWLAWSLGYLFESAAHARRVFEYIDLPDESLNEGKIPMSASGEEGALPTGDLVFKRYSMSYRESSPVVLADLTVKIPWGARVGIVGRTGAGKSSLVQALFRMVYVRGGDILVGDRSIFSLPVERSRALFTVVPQDPYLFAGSLALNIDPAGEYSEHELEEALKDVGCPVPVTTELVEGGRNLSLGERQLVALARVLLSRAPFVVLDEPTSSVDTITDAAIQEILTAKLRGRTVLTIAHRLETLQLVDLIVELREGRVVRTGSPQEILPTLRAEDLA